MCSTFFFIAEHFPSNSRYDFYLVSQSVRQGTVSPTHYNVIYDGVGLQADHMQRLSYKLTHMYFNWQVWQIFSDGSCNYNSAYTCLKALVTSELLKNMFLPIIIYSFLFLSLPRLTIYYSWENVINYVFFFF